MSNERDKCEKLRELLRVLYERTAHFSSDYMMRDTAEYAAALAEGREGVRSLFVLIDEYPRQTMAILADIFGTAHVRKVVARPPVKTWASEMREDWQKFGREHGFI